MAVFGGRVALPGHPRHRFDLRSARPKQGNVEILDFIEELAVLRSEHGR